MQNPKPQLPNPTLPSARWSVAPACAVFALSLAVTWAQPIVLKSDASTLAAATTNLALLDSGNTAGLTFHPALVGAHGGCF